MEGVNKGKRKRRDEEVIRKREIKGRGEKKM